MQDNHDPKAQSPDPVSRPGETTEGKERPVSTGRSSRSSAGTDRGSEPSETPLTALPVPLCGMLDLLAQIAATAGDMQLEVLSRKGLRIAALPVSQRQLLFGLSIDGLFFVDRVLDQSAPTIAAPLRRFQQQQILQPGREEFPRPEALEQERAALLDLTARGLRSLANRLGNSPVRVKQRPPGTTLGASANLRFSPIELLMNRPEGLSIHDDVTSHLFHHPPQGTSDSWLFLIGQPGQIWPVATINVGLKTIEDASNACQSAHNLLRFIQHHGVTLADGKQHAICMSGDGFLLLLIANANQAVLLTLPAAQLGRVLQIAQQSCISLVSATAQSAALVPSVVVSSTSTTASDSQPVSAPIGTLPAPSASIPLPEIKVVTAPAAVVAPSVGTEVAVASPSVDVSASEVEEPLSTGTVLCIRHLHVKAGEKTLIKDLDLDIPGRGVFALMGPGGAGKSTLLGVVSGATTGLYQSGELTYRGRALNADHHPMVLLQRLPIQSGILIDYVLGKLGPHTPKERLLAAELLRDSGLDRLRALLDRPIESLQLSVSQAWRIEILRALSQHPALLCVDEPTATMDTEDAEPVLELLRQIGTQRSVLFVTHNQAHAQSTASRIALMAAARLQAVLSTPEFFAESAPPLVRDYVRTGGCHVPSPDAPIEHIDPDYLTPPQAAPLPEIEPDAPQEPPPAQILWAHPQPVLTMRSFGLSIGERCRLSNVNLDIAEPGKYVLVCPDGTIRRLLHAYLSTGLQGKVTTEGELKLKGADLSEDNHPASTDLNVKLLMSSVREYLLSGYSDRLSLGSMDEKLDRLHKLLESQQAEDLIPMLSNQVLDLSSEQRRRLAIARAVSMRPSVLCLDEPFQGLDPEGSVKLREAIHRESQRRAVLILLSAPIEEWKDNAQHGYIHGEYLFAVPQEEKPSGSVSDAMQVKAQWQNRTQTLPEADTSSVATKDSAAVAIAPSTAVETAVETTVGTTPHPDSWSAKEVDRASASGERTALEPEPAASASGSEFRPLGKGPRGFHWLLPGALAGTPEPGMMHDLDYDLSLLRAAGITLLVTLTETPLDDDALEVQGLKSLFFPIVDMHAPSQRAAYDLCGLIDLQLSRGERIAFHCKAGLGRTGTLLCSYLIWKGERAEAALRQARRVEPAWVQSSEQEKFLSDFESFCLKQKQKN